MKRSDKSAPVPEGLSTRFGAVRGYFQDHVDVGAYTPVFCALDPALKDHEADIRKWWNSRAKLEPTDEPVLARMERVVELLKNAKAVA